jgi:predicted dehydrogenase
VVKAGRPRSGVIGVGMVGAVHAHAVHGAGGVLAAVAGSSPESSRAACDRLNASRAATAEDIIHAEDVDVVHMCAYPTICTTNWRWPRWPRANT